MQRTPVPFQHTLGLALALSLGAAVSLGITRFSYGLLLPSMRADLGWTYLLAGGMNTANAVGYLLGALLTPHLLRHVEVPRLLWSASVAASVLMALSGFVVDVHWLMLQRLLAGIASALVFVAGGLLAARLGALDAARAGLLLGIYYGGTGLGIVVSALLVPPLLEWSAGQLHGWRWAWWALAGVCAVASVVLVQVAARLHSLPAPAVTGHAQQRGFFWADFSYGLGAYALFGVGYIGYMTFVVALLRAQGSTSLEVTLFYALLGVAVMASSRIWAGLLTRYRGGQALALLNALLGVATLLPALTRHPVLVLVSGVLFGAVFLSVVASTTAMVRHNLPPTAWVQGISAFTIVFAMGQIVGPAAVGWIADGPGGLGRGLVLSAVALWAGAALATRQKALT